MAGTETRQRVMESLFRQGAFAGATPRDAYFVKCDKETTTRDDVNAGIVNVVVGFAPLKPAEFVIIKVQQRSGVLEVRGRSWLVRRSNRIPLKAS